MCPEGPQVEMRSEQVSARAAQVHDVVVVQLELLEHGQRLQALDVAAHVAFESKV